MSSLHENNLLSLMLLVPVVAKADAPSPYGVCEGKQAGASCASNYYPDGTCVSVVYDSGS